MQHKLNSTDRFIAVEIEVANLEDPDSAYGISECVRRWGGSIVSDGSLPATGFEINTSPASGDLFVKQIQEICTKLNNCEAVVDSSCGLHVHLDARDFDYYELRNLIKVYASLEPLFFSMVPESRENSQYCLPCGEKFAEAIDNGRLPYKEAKKKVIKATYGVDSPKDFRKEKYCSARYTALNLHSFFFRGSLECRLFNGSTNPGKIVAWALTLAKMLEFAKKASQETCDKMWQTSKNLEAKDLKSLLFMVIDNDPTLIKFIESRLEKHTR